MLNLYNDPNQGMGLGIQSMYNKLAEQYLNIKRKDVSAFIKQQSVYQITKQEPLPINKPIIGHHPNERWAVDLIDMILYEGYNKHFKYILTGIDYFSKKVFAVPLRSKTPQTTLKGLEKAITEQMGDTYPHIIQSDNGGEFKNKPFKEWAKEHHIHLIHTLSYTPTGNALVENANKWIRKMIREGFVRYNSFNWVDHLHEYIYNRNDMKHSVTKRKPNTIWSAGQNDDGENEDINLIISLSYLS
jgi:IS30 family transposase